MPIIRMKSADVSGAYDRPDAKWSKLAIAGTPEFGRPSPERHAVDRLKEGPFFFPHVEPRFQFSKNDRLFCIGTCFSRALELPLASSGFTVLSDSTKDLAAYKSKVLLVETVDGEFEGDVRFYTNKYNCFALLQELRWTFDPTCPFPEEAFLDVGDGKLVDPHAMPVLMAPADREETLARRKIVTDVFRRLLDAQVILITLGQTEVWFDKVTNLYLNYILSRRITNAAPDRFEFRLTSFQENMECLEETYSFLRQVLKRDAKIIITVSPGTLQMTCTPRDVVVATCATKATLRAVVEEFVALHSDVDYFPLYEITKWSNRDAAYCSDLCHISPELHQKNVALFRRTYVSDDA